MHTLFIPIILRFISVFVNQILVIFHNPARKELPSVGHYALYFFENTDFTAYNYHTKTFFCRLSTISFVKTANKQRIW